MKNTFLKRILALILCAIVLSAALTALVYRVYGAQVFVDMKAGELSPRVDYLSVITSEYMEGYIGAKDYQRIISSEYHIWDALLYVYDEDGQTIVMPYSSNDESAGTILTKQYLSQVLGGSKVTLQSNFGSPGVLIGQPVTSRFGNVIGAVFLVKPITEIYAALSGLNTALVITMVLVTLIMLIPVYIGSRKLVNPIKNMTLAADAMSHGDFSVRAQEKLSGEIGRLGHSLNVLSSELSKTINDLTFERNRLRTVLEGLSEGIIAVNEKNELTQCNQAALTLIGCKEAAELAKNEIFSLVKTELEKAVANDGLQTFELKNGERVLKMTSTPLANETCAVEGAVMLIQDVTEQMRLEQTRRDYVANVSHELRTPLASIRGLADALNDGLIKKEDDRERYYGYILHETIRLSRLIDDLLELSRLQSGNVAFAKQKLDVYELVMDVSQRYSSTAKENGLALVCDIDEGCPAAYSNPDRAEQVLICLLDNAIKHSQAHGEVKLEVRDKNGKLHVTVTNPGHIPDEDIGHVFERFYKVDKSHSGSGTGLGLSIAKEIMNIMGEELYALNTFDSVAFEFTLAKACEKM